MKKSAFVLAAGLAVATFSAFTAKVSPEEKSANAEKSMIHWTGSKVVGGEHKGAIDIKESNLEFKGNKLTGGMVVADMTSISNSDLEGESNTKLVGHLNSDDFFSTAKYPTATLKIKKVTASKTAGMYSVTADLTIKGMTHPQTFDVMVKESGKQMISTASVSVDRTKYNVRYGSSSFFDDLGDKAISDEFVLDVTIVTSK